jgi:predicted TPR repeat methyltransferase
MTERSSLGADYFDGIFAEDDDPWDLASSAYEAGKFAETLRALDDGRYARGLEVGCAHGVLTAKLAPLCDELLAIDISAEAIARARGRVGDVKSVALRCMAFPQEAPSDRFDLVLLSEVVYYWGSDDLARAGLWLQRHVVSGGRVLLVHYTGETDYPQTGDGAVEQLAQILAGWFDVRAAVRHDRYRLDLWTRR